MKHEADIRQSIERLREAPPQPFDLDDNTELAETEEYRSYDVSEDLPDGWSVPQYRQLDLFARIQPCLLSALQPYTATNLRSFQIIGTACV